MQKDYQTNLTTKEWKVSKPKNAEAKLWLEMKDGDESAYMMIYQKFFSALYHYGNKVCNDKELVKDCIQDLFVDIWKQRENLSATDSITYYLFAALKRRILRELSKNQIFDNDPSTQLLHISDYCAEDNIIKDEISFEQRQKIRAAMNKLTKRQREVIKLRFYQNVDNEEIANHLSIKVESAYNLISKAIHLLKKHISHLPFVAICLRCVFN